MKADELLITSVEPSIGLPGGEVTIRCRGFKPGLPSAARVMFGDEPAAIVSASSDRVVARVPEVSKAFGVALSVNGATSPVFPFVLGSRLASGLHPVTNPVIAPDGFIITTISGSRGQASPQPLLRVSRSGEVTPYPCELMNPTGLAFGPDGQLYISCRGEGTVQRYTDFEHLEVVADDLGVPCGIAFDAEGRLYVGDRTGRILRIGPEGAREEFAAIPASISAFHLAFDAAGNLYVTGPTLAMRDPVYRITPAGAVSTIIEGMARPQGMAVRRDGTLWISAAYGGKKGIFRYSPKTGELRHHVAGPMLVGLAVEEDNVFLADGTSLYWIQLGGAAGRLS
jgi:sugar lactone lactonase YvrE